LPLAGCGKTFQYCHSEEPAGDEEPRTALKTLRARFFAALRMTANELRMTARASFSAACKAPPFQSRGEKSGLGDEPRTYKTGPRYTCFPTPLPATTLAYYFTTSQAPGRPRHRMDALPPASAEEPIIKMGAGDPSPYSYCRDKSLAPKGRSKAGNLVWCPT
jgi:hypothetical protein